MKELVNNVEKSFIQNKLHIHEYRIFIAQDLVHPKNTILIKAILIK